MFAVRRSLIGGSSRHPSWTENPDICSVNIHRRPCVAAAALVHYGPMARLGHPDGRILWARRDLHCDHYEGLVSIFMTTAGLSCDGRRIIVPGCLRGGRCGTPIGGFSRCGELPQGILTPVVLGRPGGCRCSARRWASSLRPPRASSSGRFDTMDGGAPPGPRPARFVITDYDRAAWRCLMEKGRDGLRGVKRDATCPPLLC